MIQPIQPSSKETDHSSSEKIISIICIVYIGHSCYQLYASWNFIMSLVHNGMESITTYNILRLSPLGILPITVYLFWKRKVIGWLYLSSYLLIAGISCSYELYNLMSHHEATPDTVHLFHASTSQGYLVGIVLFLGSFMVMCLPGIRNIYTRSAKQLVVIHTYFTLPLIIIIYQKQLMQLFHDIPLHQEKTTISQSAQWEAYYGYIDNVYSVFDTGEKFVYNNIEFLFINKNNIGYSCIDTNQMEKAISLAKEKLIHIQKTDTTSQGFRKIEKIQINDHAFFIRLVNPATGTNLYRLQDSTGSYFIVKEFTINEKDTLPVMWTNRKSLTTQTRLFKKLPGNFTDDR